MDEARRVTHQTRERERITEGWRESPQACTGNSPTVFRLLRLPGGDKAGGARTSVEASGVCWEGGQEPRGQAQEGWANAFLSFHAFSLRSQMDQKSWAAMYISVSSQPCVVTQKC